jgi:ABC-type polysaccharide/polyol phosphate transport system ATPase subunit
MSETVITIRDLSKVYTLMNRTGAGSDQFFAIKNLSLEVKKGSCIGIVGPNGSGKSTLLKLLSGITKPSSGEILIKGKVASILDVGAGFHPELSGHENIFLHGQIMGFSREEIQRQYDKIVAYSGIEIFLFEPVKNYSNGMYLRLAFSILVHLDFDIYLFDEVINVGDKEFQLKANDKMLELAQSKTVLITTHDWNSIKQLVTSVLYINNGECKYFNQFMDFLLSQEPQVAKPPEINDHYSVSNSSLKLNDSFNIVVNNFKQNKSFLTFCLSTESKNVNNYYFAIGIRDILDNPVVEYYYNGLIYKSQTNFNIKFPIHFYNDGKYSVDLIFFNIKGILYVQKNIFNFKIEKKYFDNQFSRRSWGVIKTEIDISEF